MLMIQFAAALAAAPTPSPSETTSQVDAVTASAPEFLNTASIFGLILLAGSVIVAAIGISALMRAKKGNVKEVANIGLATLLAVVILMAGIGGGLFAWATSGLDYFTN